MTRKTSESSTTSKELLTCPPPLLSPVPCPSLSCAAEVSSETRLAHELAMDLALKWEQCTHHCWHTEDPGPGPGRPVVRGIGDMDGHVTAEVWNGLPMDAYVLAQGVPSMVWSLWEQTTGRNQSWAKTWLSAGFCWALPSYGFT